MISERSMRGLSRGVGRMSRALAVVGFLVACCGFGEVAPAQATDAFSREFTIHNDLSSGEVGGDATAREFTIHNALGDAFVADDAFTREFTIHNDLSTARVDSDSVTREFTIHNDLSSVRVGSDVVSRQFTVVHRAFGDFNGDGNVNLDDLSGFVECMTGPGEFEIVEACCFFDGEPDDDVDLIDFTRFEAAFVEP